MVMVLATQTAVTPAGKLVGVPIPVARVVAWVILVRKVLIHNVGVEEAVPAVWVEATVQVLIVLHAEALHP